MNRTLIIAGLLVACITPALAQTDLWNQQVGVPQTNVVGGANQVFTDLTTDSTYMASNVDNVQAWNVSSISIEILGNNPAILTNLKSAELNIFADGSSSLPGTSDNPTNGTSVPVSITLLTATGQNGYLVYQVTASSLNLSLASGDHWISLTPIGANSNIGQAFEALTTVNSAGALFQDAGINPSGGLGAGTNWQTAQNLYLESAPSYGGIDIKGSVQAVPAPASLFALGLGVVGLAIRRRK